MKKISLLLILAALIFSACKKTEVEESPPQLYKDAVFTNFTKQTVVYTDTFGLEMDIYLPQGDTNTNRPVVVLVHGGGFFRGTKENPAIVRLAEKFAKRGYVAVAINYHLAAGFNDILDSVKAVNLVMKSIGDARAAIRFMRKSFDNQNPYGINPNNIFMGGNSAGAILALHVGFFDDNDPRSNFVDSIVKVNGGFEGIAGSPGYSSDVKAVFNMAGGIISLAFIDATDPPVINFHGVDDDVVPFNCDDVYSGITGGLDVVNLCGSNPVHQRVLKNSGQTELFTYPGKHVPWMDNDTGVPNQMFDGIEQKVFDFIYENL